eukprot:4873286-Prymnesium_polylepis.1
MWPSRQSHQRTSDSESERSVAGAPGVAGSSRAWRHGGTAAASIAAGRAVAQGSERRSSLAQGPDRRASFAQGSERRSSLDSARGV